MVELVKEFGEIVPLPLSTDPPPCTGRPTFCFTFDDGYEDTVLNVPDVLDRFAIRATFFVVTNHLGRVLPVPWDNGLVNRASARQLAAAAHEGHLVLSHSASHRRLDHLSDSEAESDLLAADQRLKDLGLGCAGGGVVAYPFGIPPRAIPSWIRIGFSTGKVPARPWIEACHAVRRVYLDKTSSRRWRCDLERWAGFWANEWP